jgi:hypothetical protein
MRSSACEIAAAVSLSTGSRKNGVVGSADHDGRHVDPRELRAGVMGRVGVQSGDEGSGVDRRPPQLARCPALSSQETVFDDSGQVIKVAVGGDEIGEPVPALAFLQVLVDLPG